ASDEPRCGATARRRGWPRLARLDGFVDAGAERERRPRAARFGVSSHRQFAERRRCGGAVEEDLAGADAALDAPHAVLDVAKQPPCPVERRAGEAAVGRGRVNLTALAFAIGLWQFGPHDVER